MSDLDVEKVGDSEEQVQESGQKHEDADASESEGHSSADEPDEEQKLAEAEAAERRKAYRLNKVLGATMTSADGDATKTRLFVIDISVSGFRATDHLAPAQEECNISIVLVKDQEPFFSRMRVVWVKELTVSGMYQMGCEFVDVAEEELGKLDSFIEREKNQAAEASGKTALKIDNPWTMI
jgi:PilZ domain-containing protein